MIHCESCTMHHDQRNSQMAVSLLMSRHKRLGAKSNLKSIPIFLLRKIFSFAMYDLRAEAVAASEMMRKRQFQEEQQLRTEAKRNLKNLPQHKKIPAMNQTKHLLESMRMRHMSERKQFSQSSAAASSVIAAAAATVVASKSILSKKETAIAAAAVAATDHRNAMYKERQECADEYRRLHGNGPSPHKKEWADDPCEKCGAFEQQERCTGCTEKAEKERMRRNKS